jgi:RNA polymerase sigma factor (sigma-70 family)
MAGAGSMKQGDVNPRLSQISTAWSVVRQAHEGPVEAMTAAQQELLEHYGQAIHRYLLSALGDPAAADDLTQDFALNLVRGQFRRADPQHGRFRNYVKTVLFHLVSNYRKRQRKLPRSLPADDSALANLASPPEDVSHQFDENWRQVLLSRVWQKLAEAQPIYHAVLHCRAANPKMSSAEMALKLGAQLGKTQTAESIRQNLHRARAAFAELLLSEVAQSLEAPTAEQLETELADLNLLPYCQSALAHFKRGKP